MGALGRPAQGAAFSAAAQGDDDEASVAAGRRGSQIIPRLDDVTGFQPVAAWIGEDQIVSVVLEDAPDRMVVGGRVLGSGKLDVSEGMKLGDGGCR